MNSITNNKSIDLTPTGLFPDYPKAVEDKKCLIITKVFNEMAKNFDMSCVSYDIIKKNAQMRFEYLSTEQKLEIYEIDPAARLLFQSGVKLDTVKEYYSFRLTSEDLNKWNIIIPKAG